MVVWLVGSAKRKTDLEGLELLVEAGDGGGEAMLADVADVPQHPRQRRRVLLVLRRRRLRAGGRPRGGPLRLRLPLRPLLLVVVVAAVVLLVLAPRPAVLPSSVGLPPHPHLSVTACVVL